MLLRLHDGGTTALSLLTSHSQYSYWFIILIVSERWDCLISHTSVLTWGDSLLWYSLGFASVGVCWYQSMKKMSKKRSLILYSYIHWGDHVTQSCAPSFHSIIFLKLHVTHKPCVDAHIYLKDFFTKRSLFCRVVYKAKAVCWHLRSCRVIPSREEKGDMIVWLLCSEKKMNVCIKYTHSE